MKERMASLKETKRVGLGLWPTPVHRLTNLERELGHEKIYIKRDDLTGLGPGGNKTRSLEFLLADAMAQQKDTVVVSGPVQSNLCTLAACACARVGLRCLFVHNGDKPRRAEGNGLLNQLLNVETHFLGNVDKPEREDFVRRLADRLEAEGSAPYVIENGASTGMGAMGYVHAVGELCAQDQSQGLELAELFVPGGNGGVAAGLIYGNYLRGNPFTINVVSIEDRGEVLQAHIDRILNELAEITGRPIEAAADAYRILDGYYGGGWGINTAESERAVRGFPQSEGIFIENVYNSKVLVGMADRVKNGGVRGNLCYLHTGGFGSMFSQF